MTELGQFVQFSPLAGCLLGTLIGVLRAKRKGGNRLDLLHWGGIYGLIGGSFGVLTVTLASRSIF